jgi:hypothetical protein
MSITSVSGHDLSILDEFVYSKADLLLGIGCTKSMAIVEDEYIDFVPTIDAEFISRGEIKSFDDINANRYISHSAVITRAINLIRPFENISFLNLGFKKRPKVVNSIFDFNIQPTNIISDNAMVESEEIFHRGLEFGKTYKPMGDYVIVAKNMPFSELSYHCSAQALGYDDKNVEFTNNSIIQSALELLDGSEELFKTLSRVSDNVMMFLSGLLISLSKDNKVVLSGGEDVLLLLLVLDKLLDEKYMAINSDNIYIFSYNLSSNQNIDNLISQLSFKPKVFYSDYDFNIPTISDTNGLGASLIYSTLNGITQEQIINQLEQL